jgi:hypothetical protein
MIKTAKMTKTRKQNCPSCGILLNAVSDFFGEASPEPGDITVCANCKTILTFCEAMDLRLTTQEEINEVENKLNKTTQQLANRKYTLINTPKGLGILCHLCGKSSSNPHDIENRYCDFCHQFLEDSLT